MKPSAILRTVRFTDATLYQGEYVEVVRPNECPDGAVRACASRGWSLYDTSCGVTGRPTIILHEGRYRVVSSEDLEG